MRLLYITAAIMLLLATTELSAREISEKRECSICHVMWLNDFKRDDVHPLISHEPRPVVDTGKQDIVSTERMCFSCHDGFVRDSRFAWRNREHFHPVGVELPKGIELPTVEGKEIFPLNDDGKLYCGTCHTAHGTDWKGGNASVFLRRPNVNSSFCFACHLDHATGTKEGNHPLLKKLKKLPESLLEVGAKFGSRKQVICESCHRIHGAGDEKLLLVPNENSQLCGTCHSDRYARSRSEAVEMGTHPVNVSSERVEVPQQLIDKGAKLGSGGQLICQSCHRPHNALPNSKILVADNRRAMLCKQCHSDKGAVVNTVHNMALQDPYYLDQPGVAESEEGVCSDCHVPHNAEGPKLAPRAVVDRGDPVSSICLGCHSKGRVAAERLVGEHSHPVGVDVKRLPNGAKLPTFTDKGVRVEDGSRGMVSCASCHDPHRWDAKDAKRGSKPGERGSAANRFLRRPNLPDGNLCRSCHRDKGAVAGSKHDVKGEPGQPRKLCANCHVVHNGKGIKMWAGTPGEGSDVIASLCQGCHKRDGIAKDKLVKRNSHPLQVGMERLGVETDLPLYKKSGERDPQGGVSCASCHDPHQWQAQGGADGGESSAEGDATNSFLRRAAAPEPNLCVSCHKQKQWVTGTDHDLNVTAPEAQNRAGATVAESGVCGQCHAVHNAEQAHRLWAKRPGEGADGMERLCRSCHAAGQMAENKQPLKALHPQKVKVTTDTEAQSPVFNGEGEAVRTGMISCPTCHNPHQWSAKQAEQGTGVNREGDARNSFLRNRSGTAVCKNCHGMDALFRYKYFHGKPSRDKHPLYRQ